MKQEISGSYSSAAPASDAAWKTLRCVACGKSDLRHGSQSLECSACKKEIPLIEGRFADFLTREERAELAAELEFWAAHFEGVEYQDESEASYRRWADAIGSRATDAILEIGCGSGALLKRLPAAARVGLEPAVNLLTPSKGFLGVLGTALCLPFRDEAFQIVLFKHSLHHVQDRRRAFEEAVRVLAPDGKLIIIEPNAEHPQRRALANPRSWVRRSGILSRFIGPVETFQALGELLHWAELDGLEVDRAFYTESFYDRLTVRQALQKVYSRVLRPVLSEKYLLPNYFACFRKKRAAHA